MNNPTYSTLHSISETETLIHEAEEEIVALVRQQASVKDEAKESAKEFRSQLESIQNGMDRHIGIIDQLKTRRNEIERQPNLPFDKSGAAGDNADAEAPAADAVGADEGAGEGATVLTLVPPEAEQPPEPVCETCGGAGERQEATGEYEDGAIAGEPVPCIRSVPCTACRGTGRPHTVCPACDGDGLFEATADHPVLVCGTCEGSGFVPHLRTMEPEVPRADDLPSSSEPAPDSETAPSTPPQPEKQRRRRGSAAVDAEPAPTEPEDPPSA